MSTASYDHLTKEQLVELLLERDRDTESNPHRKKYGLIWEDKPEQFEADSIGRIPVLQRDAEKCIFMSPDRPTHILIQGDNYHALKVLTYTHERSVDVIYIDPPYNTGKDFVYKDKFHPEGKLIEKTDGYRHSTWLSFMSKRLRLAKALLKEDGVLFLSIDDNEFANVRLLLNEIFGEDNCLTGKAPTTLIWNKQHSQQQGVLSRYHEYVLAYAKNAEAIRPISGGTGFILAGAQKKVSRANPASEFTFPAGTRFDAKDGVVFSGTFGDSEKSTVVNGTLQAKNGVTVSDVTISAGWTQKRQMESWFAGKETLDTKGQKVVEFFFTSTGKLKCRKERSAITPSTILPSFGMVSEATSALAGILGKPLFNNPKPVELVKYLVSLFLRDRPNGVVLDFFAGSGTTAHAVMELNEEVGGRRQALLVTNDEGSFSDDEGNLLEGGICTHVTYPRLKRVISGYTADGADVGGLAQNLAFFRTDFVEDKALERVRRTLSERSADAIALREGCYLTEPCKDRRWKSFSDGVSRRVVVVTDQYAADDLIPLLRADKRETVVYVFRFGDAEDPANEYGGKGLEHVTAKPIPDSLLALHRRILKQEVKAV